MLDTKGILKNWMLRNLEHPYPSAQEKLFLQAQTGLSATQLNNWLSNARRRKFRDKIRRVRYK